jgi:hypothetical protein
MSSNTYSFLDIVAAMVGPGVAANLGNGAAVAEEGIEIQRTGDIGSMTIGSDGAGMHSLHADKSGTVTVRCIKNSETNRILSAAYAFQTSSGASYGSNTITIVDKQRGDVTTCSQCGFKKYPDLKYAKDADIIAWEFNAVRIESTLGA